MKRIIWVGFLGTIVLSAATAYGADPEFGSYWHDGRAELDGYRWEGTRYGEPRSGTCVMVFVTEPFSRSKMVKVDDPSADPEDTFDVLKLNMIRDFQTGIYDYNTMVSVFSRTRDFSPVKISFSSAEWCGHVYGELLFGDKDIKQQYFSYFEDESGSRTLEQQTDGISEDNLFILLRGLRGELMAPGEKQSMHFLPGSFYSRLLHNEPGWTKAEIGRAPSSETIRVPAGEFITLVYTVKTQGGRTGRFFIEEAYPHRVIRWSWTTEKSGVGGSERGEFTGSTRLKYWEFTRNGHERYLEDLGLGSAGD